MKNPRYTFKVLGNSVLKTDELTGTGYSWEPRVRKVRLKRKASNGVTIESLEQAGHKVRIKHFRWATYEEFRYVPDKRDPASGTARGIVVPSVFRKDPAYTLAPNGGYTHIVITHGKSGKVFCVSSECSQEDPFCYSKGVAAAFERLSAEDISHLAN